MLFSPVFQQTCSTGIYAHARTHFYGLHITLHILAVKSPLGLLGSEGGYLPGFVPARPCKALQSAVVARLPEAADAATEAVEVEAPLAGDGRPLLRLEDAAEAVLREDSGREGCSGSVSLDEEPADDRAVPAEERSWVPAAESSMAAVLRSDPADVAPREAEDERTSSVGSSRAFCHRLLEAEALIDWWRWTPCDLPLRSIGRPALRPSMVLTTACATASTVRSRPWSSSRIAPW